MNIANPFARPFYVMLKPIGYRCNLACCYCYYLEKRNLYGGTDDFCMSDKLLEDFTRQYIEAQTMSEVLFTWHGGEPLLRQMSFYQHALDLQKRYAHGRKIDNCIQTNGTLLTDEWCKFLHDNDFLVGISIDGPKRFHDVYRAQSFDKVMHGIDLLNKYGVEWNAMAVVNNLNVEYPIEFYRFFKNIGCRYLQFTPIVERKNAADRLVIGMGNEGKLTKTSVSSIAWGRFICEIFDEWVRNDVGETFVQLFDATLANWAGVSPGVCSLAPTCGQAAAMEFNGDVYSCDHFVFPEYKLGNICNRTITEMMYSERQSLFGTAKRTSLPQQCKECKYLFACNGECPKNRFISDSYGTPGLNYLCEGYYQYFSHVAPYMDYMKMELDGGRAPSNIMAELSRLG